MTDLRVLIVGDNLLARRGLAALLAGQPGLAIAGERSSAGWPEDLESLAADVAVWDWEAEAADAPDLRGAGLPVVALLRDGAGAAAARSAGARGLLRDDTEPEALAAALHAAVQGLVVMSPGLLDALLPVEDAAAPPQTLTPREREVLQLLAEGLPNKVIALRLGITEHTVKFHVNALLGKLNAQSRTDAVVRATRLGLIIL